MTNTMGTSLLLMAAAALMVGFIPILTWINLFIALPLAAIGTISTGITARKPIAQPADKALFWIGLGLAATILLRSVTI